MIRGQLKQNLGLCYKAAGGVHGTQGKWSRAPARDELKGWNALFTSFPSLQIGFPASAVHKVACNMHFPPQSLLEIAGIDQLSAQAEFQIPGPEIWIGLTLVRCSPQAQAAGTDSGELVV